MTYTVSGGTLNPTHSLDQMAGFFCYLFQDFLDLMWQHFCRQYAWNSKSV